MNSDPWWRSRTPVRNIPLRVSTLLRNARIAHGWTLDQAADHIGCGWRMICHLEAGDRAPSVALARDIADTYQLGPDDREQLVAVARPHSGRSSPYRTGAVPTRNPVP